MNEGLQIEEKERILQSQLKNARVLLFRHHSTHPPENWSSVTPGPVTTSP